jgi:ubiquinone/menaquinone biosynthesis C-methylase UbiE
MFNKITYIIYSMSKKNIKEHWNLIASDYQKDRNLSFDDILYALGYARESDLILLGEVKGKKIVELGCGAAENCITLAKKGGICTGVDMSSEQLKIAQKLAEENNVKIELIEDDIEKLSKLDYNSFDIAISIFALDWMQDLFMAFKQAYRILKPKGIFVFSIQHPIYNLLCAEDVNLKNLKISESYFEKETTFTESTGIDLRVHASTISDIINDLIRIGFGIDEILEPKPMETDILPNEEFQEVFKIIPSTLICKVRKVPIKPYSCTG